MRHRRGSDEFTRVLAFSDALVAFFLASVPVAFLNTRLAVAVWLALVPAEMLLNRRRPAGAERYFGSASRQPR